MADASDFDMKDLSRRMDKAVAALKEDFAGLRSGRASAAMVEPITVDVYGAAMPLNQVATITVPEPRTIAINVWDKGNVGAVEKAIRDSGLGITPNIDGQMLRLAIPALTEERRKELAKLAGKYAENARVAVRNIRRDGMDEVKKLEKKGLGEDEARDLQDQIQSKTDAHVKTIDETLAAKEQEIMQV